MLTSHSAPHLWRLSAGSEALQRWLLNILRASLTSSAVRQKMKRCLSVYGLPQCKAVVRALPNNSPGPGTVCKLHGCYQAVVFHSAGRAAASRSCVLRIPIG